MQLQTTVMVNQSDHMSDARTTDRLNQYYTSMRTHAAVA